MISSIHFYSNFYLSLILRNGPKGDVFEEYVTQLKQTRKDALVELLAEW